MGTDIHLMLQVKQGGNWLDIEPCAGWSRPRNYDLFAILANIRNGSGFAGVPTGEGFVPISEPRGIPQDLQYRIKDPDNESIYITRQSQSTEYLAMKRVQELMAIADDPTTDPKTAENSKTAAEALAKEHGIWSTAVDQEDLDYAATIWLGYHDHSWLSLADLVRYDWKQKSVTYMGLDLQQYADLPDEIKTNTVYKDRKVLTKVVYPHFADSTAPYERCCAVVDYEEAAGEDFGALFKQMIELSKLADGSEPENVRIVFGFDS